MWDGIYEDRYVVGVYATLEDAMQSHEHKSYWESAGQDVWSCEHSTRHKTGNVPIDQPITFDTLTVPVIDGSATLPDGRVLHNLKGSHVVVPVVPKVEWEREWTTGCDARIEAHEVLSAVPV
jgi:hypothetical protein